ncbi:MAG: hypothetical protein ACLR0U_17900 [Enterocloster clostridioformis]
MDGRLPILFDSGHQFRAGISPVSRYSGYDGDETGSYDLTVMAVTSDFFTQMDEKVKMGQYRKYDEWDENGDLGRLYPKGVGNRVEPAEGWDHTQELYRGITRHGSRRIHQGRQGTLLSVHCRRINAAEEMELY